ncbi:hypothetical protein QYE76_034474 [Lolium multiflorum]|uniref:Uncharacterized protein n=1 Tax=Lolium multiflorum TaxID=4521 RepID=A0AAD8QXT3_LOLMU|nr:hypothetical protein QYE76_034474 [Lolium multiflorum]
MAPTSSPPREDPSSEVPSIRQRQLAPTVGPVASGGRNREGSAMGSYDDTIAVGRVLYAGNLPIVPPDECWIPARTNPVKLSIVPVGGIHIFIGETVDSDGNPLVSNADATAAELDAVAKIRSEMQELPKEDSASDLEFSKPTQSAPEQETTVEDQCRSAWVSQVLEKQRCHFVHFLAHTAGTAPQEDGAGPEQQAGEIDNLTVSLGQSTLVVLCGFHVGAGITGVAPHYISPPSTFNVLLDSYWTNVDPNNVPLASLVAQEEHVDVNFIKNNNFNNNAYRNNSSNNYRPYPYNNGNGYGNSYGNSYNNNRSSPPGLEAMLKEFISTQTAFNKSVEEKLGKIDILASKVDSLAADVDLLKSKVLPNENHHNKITTTANAIQVRINENIRLMAELRARWDREENEKLAKEKNIAKVWTITTTSNANATHVAAPPTHTNKRIGVSNVSTSNAKREKLPETAKTAETACDKTAEIFSNIGDDDPIALDYNGLNFDDCHISEVIKFLQKLAKSPNASAINLAFTHHITNALIKAREEKLEREASIPKKLEDGWEPIIKMKVKDFDCNALCDLGASISVMPKKIYNMLDLPPLKNCYLDVNLADHSTKKPLGKVDNVHITINNNLVPVDFVVLDIECNASCPIILGRPFLRTVGAVIDMKEGAYFSTKLQKSEGETKRGDEGPHPRAARAPLGRAALWCGAPVRLLTYPSAYKSLRDETPYREPRYGKPSETPPPPIPSRGIQEIASGTLPERGIISRRTLRRHGRLRCDV